MAKMAAGSCSEAPEPVLRGAAGARASADRLVSKLLAEIGRLRAQLGGGQASGAVAVEVARREALARPALTARACGREEPHPDRLVRNVALHAKVCPFAGAPMAAWRGAQHGPRLGADGGAELCDFGAEEPSPPSETGTLLRADAVAFIPQGAGWELIARGTRCSCGAAVFSSTAEPVEVHWEPCRWPRAPCRCVGRHQKSAYTNAAGGPSGADHQLDRSGSPRPVPVDEALLILALEAVLQLATPSSLRAKELSSLGRAPITRTSSAPASWSWSSGGPTCRSGPCTCGRGPSRGGGLDWTRRPSSGNGSRSCEAGGQDVRRGPRARNYLCVGALRWARRHA
ncbi:unnamed protein product [Prorocentrum cordatum]|uniref:Uncharacterized protein n=1 Tax=Prorocentrum cordatum TaxID=2364126 RepID=A0ABN9RS11_9DINO|nr:unnamed protein product [Polarella glacialis]